MSSTSRIAVVIVDHGSRRAESNDCLLAVADSYRATGRFPIVEPAHMELAEPSLETAFRRAVEQGASHIVVFPFFLFTGRHWHSDIPRLAREASQACGDIPFLVTAPLGNHPLMMDIMQDRIDHCMGVRTGNVEECEACGDGENCGWSDQR